MRLHECSCAYCDFDKRMQASMGKRVDYVVREDFAHLLPMAKKSPSAFAYNMDEYTNVYVEAGLEWCQSYH
jgi:hypothetical protein